MSHENPTRQSLNTTYWQYWISPLKALMQTIALFSCGYNMHFNFLLSNRLLSRFWLRFYCKNQVETRYYFALKEMFIWQWYHIRRVCLWQKCWPHSEFPTKIFLTKNRFHNLPNIIFLENVWRHVRRHILRQYFFLLRAYVIRACRCIY